jgi:hypothetical protein
MAEQYKKAPGEAEALARALATMGVDEAWDVPSPYAVDPLYGSVMFEPVPDMTSGYAESTLPLFADLTPLGDADALIQGAQDRSPLAMALAALSFGLPGTIRPIGAKGYLPEAVQAAQRRVVEPVTALVDEIIPDEIIPTDKIMPVHDVTDTTKLERLVNSMATEGWQGDPILVIAGGNEPHRALTGSHRWAAANQEGINVPVRVLDPGLSVDDEIEDLWFNLANAGGSDEDRLELLERLLEAGEVDADAVDLMRRELER